MHDVHCMMCIAWSELHIHSAEVDVNWCLRLVSGVLFTSILILLLLTNMNIIINIMNNIIIINYYE